MRALARRLRTEHGTALVMSLGIMSALATSVAAVIALASSAFRTVEYGNAGQSAYALAEAGMNDAVSVLNSAYSLGTTQFPGDSTLLPSRTTEYPDGASVTWGGSLQEVSGRPWSWQWKITSSATVANPTGPATPDENSVVTAVVPVVLPQTQSIDTTDVLNWIYALKDATFNNQLSIASPLYAGGNLTLTNKAAVAGSAGELAVGGLLTMAQNADGVGSSGARLGEAHLTGGCAWKGDANGVLRTPCLGDADNVFVASGKLDSTIPPGLVTIPTLTCCAPMAGAIAPAAGAGSSTLGFWYANAAPGPDHPCDPSTVTGTPPTFDTGDGTINDSATPLTPVNLTPWGASYTCKVVAEGKTLGELSWNASTKVLTVNGTVFIDGSATIDKTGYSGNPVFRYAGEGTIYLSGTFAMKSTTICAVAGTSACNTTAGAWDPTQTALVVIADGDGGAGGAQSQGNVVSPGDGIELVSSGFQGALIANENIRTNTTAVDQGPMVSVYNGVYSGQTGTLTFPAVGFAPTGAAGVASGLPAAQLLPPVDFS
jgi:hypothetical protein